MAQHKTYEELSAFAVPGLEGAFYIPNWLNQEEAGELAHNVCGVLLLLIHEDWATEES